MRAILVGLLAALFGCGIHTHQPIGHADAFLLAAKVLSHVKTSRFAALSGGAVRELLGDEVSRVVRLPAQIDQTWTEDLFWRDSTGMFAIAFVRHDRGTTTYSEVRVTGQFGSKDDALQALTAWADLLSDDIARRAANYDHSSGRPLELDVRPHRGVYVIAGVDGEGAEWHASLDVRGLRGGN